MKRRTLSIAIVLAGMTGVAMAGGPANLMQPVTVSTATIAECTPPNGNTGHACDGYDQMLRANFSSREIGLLFGNRTAFAGYVAGDRGRLQKRYEALVRQYLASQHQASQATTVASAK